MALRSASPDTRDRLIQAAIRLFGEFGFEATTTRALAEAAGANIGSIAYHFGHKHGLYLAAARHIAEQLRTRLALDAPAPGADRDAALAALRAVTRRMVRTFAEDEECRRWLLLVMREQVRPGEAFEILQAEAFGLVQATLGGLIARLTDRAIDDRRVILETHTLIGQIVFFLIGREPLLRRLEVAAFDETILADIEAVIGAQLRLYAAPNGDLTPRDTIRGDHMQQPIVGYHRDEEGHWVAELACGHCQHVRHNPPWVERPWVLSEAGRRSRLGLALGCVKCDRGEPRDLP